MNMKPATETRNGVTLIRPGCATEVIEMHEGASLADLIQIAEAKTNNSEVFIDGRPLEECLLLRPGMVVMVVPRPKNAARGASWRDTVGMSRDDPLFEESVKAGRAYREAQGEAADLECDPTLP